MTTGHSGSDGIADNALILATFLDCCCCLSCAADSPTDRALFLIDPLFFSDIAAAEIFGDDKFLPGIFWAPRPAEEDWPDEATPPRVEWDSDSDGRGPLSRKGLPAT